MLSYMRSHHQDDYNQIAKKVLSIMDSQVFDMRELSTLLGRVITRQSSLLRYSNHINNYNPKDLERMIIHSSIIEHNSPHKRFSTSSKSPNDSRILVQSSMAEFEEVYIIKTKSFHQLKSLQYKRGRILLLRVFLGIISSSSKGRNWFYESYFKPNLCLNFLKEFKVNLARVLINLFFKN